MLKGAIHIHSTYSDGEFTLAELRDVFMRAGCDFVCMTDHAEAFDAATVRSYVEECQALSDNRFSFIAGLEYTCDRRMHVLGYGVTSRIDTTDPQEVIRHIGTEGGVSVIAHPMDSMFEWIEGFETLPDGIETWNTKYDGRLAPRPGTFRLLNRLQSRKPEMRAFYGQDLHWKKQPRELFNVIDSPNRSHLLHALARGSYCAVNDELTLPSSGSISPLLLDRFAESNAAHARRRALIKRGKQFLDGCGLTIPGSLKSQLRRIF